MKLMTRYGPTAGCAWLALLAVAGLPLLAYWVGGSGALEQLFGWLFN